MTSKIFKGGLIIKQKILFADYGKCTGCTLCEVACSLHHEKECNPSKSRIHAIKWEELGADVPMVCVQCDEPVCEAVCPVAAIHRDAETNAILIDHETCIGCKMCAMACPFGAITIDIVGKKALVCDLCEGNPVCVKFCEPKALQYIPASQAILMKKREAAQKLGELTRKLITP